MIARKLLTIVLASSLALLFSCAKHGPAQQKSFNNLDDAVRALVTAADSSDNKDLMLIFGPAGKDVISSGDPVQDRNQRATFAAKARQGVKLERATGTADRMLILTGEDEDPFAVPLVRTNNGWQFDTEQGREELLARRMGANELDAIDICNGYVEAQNQYALEDPARTGIAVYAERLVSSPGKKDGLYWPEQEGGRSPVSAGIAKAAVEGDTEPHDKPVPYHGYYFKILQGQGPNAPGGARDYVQQGLMIGGFALLAWPAEYGASGIKSFLVSHDGIVYEKNLGPSTPVTARGMTAYNPDTTWRRVE
jgi:hypothetical protein